MIIMNEVLERIVILYKTNLQWSEEKCFNYREDHERRPNCQHLRNSY